MIGAFDFQFVQNYIFATNKLKAMIGANRLLAKALRSQIPENPRQGIPLDETQKILFERLRECEAALSSGRAPDDPLANFSKGVLSASGGHFVVELGNEEACAWERSTRAALRRIAPGLFASVVTSKSKLSEPFARVDEELRQELGKKKFQSNARAQAVPSFPYMRVCGFTGTDPAIKETAGRPTGQRALSMLEAGSDGIAAASSYDPAAFVESMVLKAQGGSVSLPDDFTQFFAPKEGRKQLAVIAIDGNDVGASLKRFQKPLARASYLASALACEGFFYRLRLLTRTALILALTSLNLSPIATKDVQGKPQKVLPLRLLMLGGDDALLVMRADQGMDFMLQFASYWDDLLGERPGCKAETVRYRQWLEAWRDAYGPFTFKAGVAVVPHSHPFHAARDLAADLEGSAKRACRENNCNGVDWHALFASRREPLSAIRDREYVRRYAIGEGDAAYRETLVLTRRPYPIFPVETPGPSLQAHWTKAATLHKANTLVDEAEGKGLARSKLKLLRSVLDQGREEAELVIRELKAESTVAGQVFDGDAFTPSENGTFVTEALDIVELVDLHTERDRAECGHMQSEGAI
ncbi:MAG: hypothetical protein AAGU21_00315 [Solidesulfovibrio sp.]|uniref:hypothetical protein n=1 Tax=Solidesulfovibrio sp. TaxID=2910990 RepID=UPI0031580A20